MLEFIAVVLTLFCAYYTVKGNKVCWPFGIASTAIYLYLLYNEHLYGQVFADTIILIQCFYGWYYWDANEEDDMKLNDPRKTKRDLLILAGLSIVLIVLFKKFTNNPQPELDIITTLLSLLANWYLARKLINGYLLWVLADIFFIWMFIHQHMYWSAGLYFILISFSLLGFLKWIKNT
jgi:nicotinamide mononucleotide transporter